MSLKTPTLSIITPSLNQGRFIEAAIESVRQPQSAEGGIEHVVVDGGSTDETLTVLRRWGDQVTWISEPDRGQADAFNKGLRLTRGDVVGWLNSDDVFYPDALATVRAHLARHPELDVVYGQADHIDQDGRQTESYATGPWNFGRLIQECYLCQPAVFFRRHVVDRFGGLDPRLHYCLDYEYWIRLAQGGVRFGFLPTKLAGSRMYPENKTMRDRVRFHAEINGMLRMRLKRVPDRWILSYAHALVEAHIPRSRLVLHCLALCAAGLYASLRWNHCLTPAVWQRSVRWFGWGVLSLAGATPAP